MLEHMTYFCQRRLTECPNKCGICVRFHKLSLHEFYCPNRIISCDRDSKQCENQMNYWFRKEFVHDGDITGGHNDDIYDRKDTLKFIEEGNEYEESNDDYNDNGNLCDDVDDGDFSVDDNISFNSYDEDISLISDISKNIQKNIKKGSNYIQSQRRLLKAREDDLLNEQPELRNIDDYRRGSLQSIDSASTHTSFTTTKLKNIISKNCQLRLVGCKR